MLKIGKNLFGGLAEWLLRGSRKAVGIFSLCRFESYTHRQFMKIFNFLKKKESCQNGNSLKEIFDQLKELKKDFEKISKEVEELKKKNEFHIQKIGMVRFNPFQEIGGNQSFSLALLDANDNGVVITSLYTREGNRVYGKPIKNGKSEYLLSEEEKEAIEKAKHGRNQTKFNTQTTGGSFIGTH